MNHLSRPAYTPHPLRLQRGFTLPEVLVTIGIMGLISTVVLMQYTRFDSRLLMQNNAYEIALAIRQAQTFATSVRGEGEVFTYGYGVSFGTTTATNRTLSLYRNTGGDQLVPRYSASQDQLIGTVTIGRGNYISDICIEGVCGKTAASITFNRPDTDALIVDHYAATAVRSNIEIHLASIKDPSATRVITVYNTGQINVE
jgi:prepilin-type N-terminal cleavage/methylation domain-containing protein